jgi:predicted  nucleic acid-binding Zn-ribbon protein
MKLYHHDATSCNWDGETYEPGEDGAFEVPAEAVAALASHGFTTDSPAPSAPTAVPASGNPAQWTKEILEAEAARLGVNPALVRVEMIKAVAAARKAEAEKASADADAAEKAARIDELEAKGTERTEAEEAELDTLLAE